MRRFFNWLFGKIPRKRLAIVEVERKVSISNVRVERALKQLEENLKAEVWSGGMDRQVARAEFDGAKRLQRLCLAYSEELV